jgi:hypothetical protein
LHYCDWWQPAFIAARRRDPRSTSVYLCSVFCGKETERGLDSDSLAPQSLMATCTALPAETSLGNGTHCQQPVSLIARAQGRIPRLTDLWYAVNRPESTRSFKTSVTRLHGVTSQKIFIYTHLMLPKSSSSMLPLGLILISVTYVVYVI